MKKLSFYAIAVMLFLLPSCSNAQFLKKVSKALEGTTTTGFTEDEATAAIREALIKGTGESVNLVSVVDGYFKNPEIKIPFPPEAVSIESKLRAVGLGAQVDKAVLSINRAAEDAAKEAKPIFVAAVKGMTIREAINIVRGKENAATEYLKNTTSPELKLKFRPVIEQSLNEVNATKYWTDVINSYNKIPLVQKMNPDLAGYVTDKAIEGLFIMIAKEELKIRKDPVARTTELLKKVFGS
jgi:phosphoribosylcarboxyaminoimidazole (NCAIR) mutase